MKGAGDCSEDQNMNLHREYELLLTRRQLFGRTAERTRNSHATGGARMEMTLDEYLAEIDRWKEPVTERALLLSASERVRSDREARNWLEAKLGRRLTEAPPPGQAVAVANQLPCGNTLRKDS